MGICVAVRRRLLPYGKATQHAAQMELMLRPSTYDDAVFVNAAVEINELDTTSPYVVWTEFKWAVLVEKCRGRF